MSMENICSFNLKSIKQELDIKNKVSKYKTTYSYLKKNPFGQKLNPKLKLPPITKVISDVTNIDTISLDVKLNKIKQDINHLKKIFNEDSIELDSKCEKTSCSTLDDPKTEISEISVLSLVDDIIVLEGKLEESVLELDRIRKGRLKEQNEICLEIQTLNKGPFEKRNSQIFLKACNYKGTKNKSIQKPQFNPKRVKTININRRKSQDQSINTQLSKNTNMSTLTDEEKARIQELLADMDENGEDIVSLKLREEEDLSNGFTFGDSDKTVIDEIQAKLKNFEDTKEKRDLITQFDGKNYNQIDWKDIKNLNMKEIDKALETIRTTEKADVAVKIDKLEETT